MSYHDYYRSPDLALISKIYVDKNQCEKFGVEYFEQDSFNITTKELRESKSYDEKHIELFDAYPNELVHLSRSKEDAPGWYSWRTFR